MVYGVSPHREIVGKRALPQQNRDIDIDISQSSRIGLHLQLRSSGIDCILPANLSHSFHLLSIKKKKTNASVCVASKKIQIDGQKGKPLKEAILQKRSGVSRSFFKGPFLRK